VVELGELPTLADVHNIQHVMENREVILVDHNADDALRKFVESVEAAVGTVAATEGRIAAAQRVAAMVAARLGGAMSDAALGAQYQQYSQSEQRANSPPGPVLQIGGLTVRSA
jgi:Ethylene-responsive protein kinase Le-CTR1